MRKIAAEEFYIAYCRLLVANLTKNDTLPWVLLIHFAIEIDFPCYQITLELTLLKLTQPFFIQSFPGSLWSVLAFPEN